MLPTQAVGEAVRFDAQKHWLNTETEQHAKLVEGVAHTREHGYEFLM